MIFKKEWYVGEVCSVEDDMVQVKCMKQIGGNFNKFAWPDKNDIRWFTPAEIFCNVEPPVPVTSRVFALFQESIYLPINLKFLQDAVSGIIFYIHMLPVDFMIEFVPNLKYLCFDLMFLQKINQVIPVEILFFLDLSSVLRSVIFFVTFYFL